MKAHRFPRCPRSDHEPLPKLALALALILAASFPAGAAFSGGWLETFNGTDIDTDTWRLDNPQAIAQSNAVFFAGASNPGLSTQLTTVDVGLGIGGAAQVQVTLSALTSTPNYVQEAYLALTTDSSGFGITWDSYGVMTELVAGPPSFYSGMGGGATLSVTNSSPIRAFPVSLNTTYSLRLERLSDTAVRYTVLNSQSLVLGQITRSLPSHTDPLRVALGVRSVDATFDNLQLFGTIIPEPTTFTLFTAGWLALMVLKRK